MSHEKQRRCNTCKELKPVTEFQVKTNSGGGEITTCRACIRIYHRKFKRQKIRSERNTQIRDDLRKQI